MSKMSKREQRLAKVAAVNPRFAKRLGIRVARKSVKKKASTTRKRR